MHFTTSESKDDYTIISMVGSLDSTTAEEAEKWVSSFQVPKGKPLIIDFSDLDYISSAGLRVIFNFARRLKKNGNKFAVCQAQDHIREIFEISGFDTFIPMIDTPEDFID